MSGLVRETINGQEATVAYLDKIGGSFVDPARAGVVIAVFDNGEKSIFFPTTQAQERTEPVHATETPPPGLVLTPTDSRCWTGDPVPCRRMVWGDIGALGEQIALAYVRLRDPHARLLNETYRNTPIDLLAGDTGLEVKTGLASNSREAQQWRTTVGEPSNQEKVWAAFATREAKLEMARQKQAAILARKHATLVALSREAGRTLLAKTMGIIVNPDTKHADIYLFDGFESQIRWRSADAQAGYVGSFFYREPTALERLQHDLACTYVNCPDMEPATPEGHARLKDAGLKIPPAWKDVHINRNPQAALQAVGKDTKGRTQYLYSAAHSERAAAEKFARLKAFHKEMPSLRAKLVADLNPARPLDPADRDSAAVLYLIAKTGFRIGSNDETGGSVKAYGASTLEARHAKVNGDTVSFVFTGKHGVPITQTVTDARLATLIAERQAGKKPTDPLFATDDGKVREYLHERDGHFKVKDFRTWTATVTALKAIAQADVPTTKTAYAKAVKAVAKLVAARLGNTPQVALKSYIDPSAFSKWQAAVAKAATRD